MKFFLRYHKRQGLQAVGETKEAVRFRDAYFIDGGKKKIGNEKCFHGVWCLREVKGMTKA